MQNLPVYLYANLLDIILDLDPTVRGVNRVMYQRDLKIQKGLNNQVRVQFKNSDQKRITISNSQTFIFSMFDAIDNRMVLEKEIEVLDVATTATRGLALLTLNESDTVDLDRTSYQYSIKLAAGNGTYLPTYTNTYYGISGTLHLLNDVFPTLQDSKVINSFNKHWDDEFFWYEHVSGNIYANPEFNGNNALHTVALYMTGFRGTVQVEATLSNSPSNNSSYAVVAEQIYLGFSGIDYVNFNGVYSYIRVKFIPAQGPTDPDNDNPAYYGSLDKALYRS
jgi:hypothetical protein